MVEKFKSPDYEIGRAFELICYNKPINLTQLKKLNLYYVAGSFFILAQVFIFSALLFDADLRAFLVWSCNNFCIFLAIASFRKNMQMVMGISYLGLVTQLLWMADFMSGWVGLNLSGISDYIYKEGFTYANDVSIFLHLVVPLMILIFTIKTKPAFSSLMYALPYIFFLYIATLIFTPPLEDINCVYLACGNDQYFPYNIYLWPFYAVASTLISYVIHMVIYNVWLHFSKIKRFFNLVIKY